MMIAPLRVANLAPSNFGTFSVRDDVRGSSRPLTGSQGIAEAASLFARKEGVHQAEAESRLGPAEQLPNQHPGNDCSHRDQGAPAVSLVNALPDVVAAADPYPLAWAGWRFFDDRPSVNVDVRRGGDAAPEYRIRVRGIEGHRRRYGRDGHAGQK